MGIAIIVPGVDWSSRNLGKVTPAGNLPVESVEVIGQDTIYGATQFSVNLRPTFTTQRSVTWSVVSGGTYATIDENGIVTPALGASANSVTIRATSTANSSVYGEKTISVTAGTLVFHDYLESDGNAYIVHPGLSSTWEAKLIVKGTLNNDNGYLFGCRQSATSSSLARLAAFQTNTRHAVSALAGSKGFTSLGFIKADSATIYRWEFQCSRSGQTDGRVDCYEDATDTLKGTITGCQMGISALISIFTLGAGASGGSFSYNSSNNGAVKFCGLTIEKDNVTLVDLRPCTMDGIPAIQDVVSGNIYYNSGSSGLTAGDF